MNRRIRNRTYGGVRGQIKVSLDTFIFLLDKFVPVTQNGNNSAYRR
jgi:hypothetical protein